MWVIHDRLFFMGSGTVRLFAAAQRLALTAELVPRAIEIRGETGEASAVLLHYVPDSVYSISGKGADTQK